MDARVVSAALAAAIAAAAPVGALAQHAAPLSYTPADVAYRAAHDAGGSGAGGAGVSTPVGRALGAVMDAAAKRDWVTAVARLMQARAVAHPSAFDAFEIEVVAAFVALGTRDHAGALASYRKVVASPLFASALAPKEARATLKNAMVLSNEAGDYAGAIGFGERLAAMGPMDDAATLALASAYLADGRGAEARKLAQATVDAAAAAGRTPDDAAVEIVAKSEAAAR